MRAAAVALRTFLAYLVVFVITWLVAICLAVALWMFATGRI
jgi:hypothetical protein